MFAIIKTGGRQYCVKQGDVIKVDKLEAKAADVVSLNDVLLASLENGDVRVGDPVVLGARVDAEVLKHVRNEKIIVFKKKRRHNYRRKKGHRQWMTVLKVTEISFAG